MFRMIHTFVGFSSRKPAVSMFVSGFLLCLLFGQSVWAQVCLWYATAVGALLAIQTFRASVRWWWCPHLHKGHYTCILTQDTDGKVQKAKAFWTNKYQSRMMSFPKCLCLPSLYNRGTQRYSTWSLMYVVYLADYSLHQNAFLLQPILDKAGYNKTLF